MAARAFGTLNHQRLGRRAVLRRGALGLAGLAGAALVGCGDSEEAGDASGGGAASTPGSGGAAAAAGAGIPANIVRGGGWSESLGVGYVSINNREVVMGGDLNTSSTATIVTQDPERHFGGADLAATNDRLFLADGWSAELIPDMVESWEVPDPQGLEYILKIRPGIKTHPIPPLNGRIFTAHDVAWCINRKAGKLEGVDTSAFLRVGQYVGMNRAEAIDDVTVRIVMDSPNGGILNSFTHPGAIMYAQELADEEFKDPTRLAGTGAWIQTEFVEGTRQVMEAFPDYYRSWDEGGRPGFDRWVRSVVADRASMVAGFLTGEFDSFNHVAPHEKQQIESAVSDAWWVTAIDNGWNYFGMNPNLPEMPWFKDQRVWRAMQLSLDYPAMARTNHDQFLYTGPVPAMFPEAKPTSEVAQLLGYNEETKEEAVQEALRLLDAAGYRNGAGIRFKYDIPAASGPYFDMAIRAQDFWKRNIPEMQVELQPHATSAPFVERQVGRTYEGRTWQYASVPDAALEVRTYFHSEGGRNYEGYSDPAADIAIDKMIQAQTLEERADAIRPFEDKVLNEGTPLLPLFVRMTDWVYQSTIGGFDMVSGSFSGTSYPGTQRWFWRTK